MPLGSKRFMESEEMKLEDDNESLVNHVKGSRHFSCKSHEKGFGRPCLFSTPGPSTMFATKNAS